MSESNVCRSVLAEAIMRDLLEAAGMANAVSVASAGSRDYNVGDGPDPLLVAVADELQLRCAAAGQASATDLQRLLIHGRFPGQSADCGGRGGLGSESGCRAGTHLHALLVDCRVAGQCAQ